MYAFLQILVSNEFTNMVMFVFVPFENTEPNVLTVFCV